MSFAAVAAKTYCSKSSLERYLNGKLVPPREVVLAVADVCDGDHEQLMALWGAAVSEAAETPARSRRETVDAPTRDIERTTEADGAQPAEHGEMQLAELAEPAETQPVEHAAAPRDPDPAVRRPRTIRWSGPVGGFVAGVLVAAVLAVLVAESRQDRAAGGSKPADQGCDPSQVCFYRGDGITGRFTRITEYWQPVTRSRAADALVNTRRDVVVWLWWNDGPAACVPPLRTVRLTTRQPLQAIRVSAQRACPGRGADRPDRLQSVEVPGASPHASN